MYMSGQSLLIILVVGLIAGWLAGQIMQGTGFGLVGDLVIGVIGAFIGGGLLPQLGIHLGSGIISAIIDSTVGALLLLLVMRLVRGGNGWRARLGRGWNRLW
jgi:uncharacterized membrane protein YeaQ/YmgE (transglycosylase-associated protein family)